MNHEGVIVTQETGKRIPKQFLEIAQANRSNYIGVAIPGVSEDGAQRVMQISGPQFTLDDVEATSRGDNGVPQVWFFARHDEGMSNDNMQPYVLLRDAKDKPLICCFLAGEFDRDFTHKEGKQTNEFFVVNEYLIRKVRDIFEQSGNNLTLTVKELKQSHIRKEIEKNCRRSGESKMQITMIAAVDELPVWSYVTVDPTSFDWGSSTEAFGYTEKTEEKPVERKSGMFEKEPMTEPKVDIPKTPVVIPDDEGKRYKDALFTPPDNIAKAGTHACKNWYKNWAELPKDEAQGKWREGTARVKVRESMLKQIPTALANNKVKLWDPKPIAGVEPITTQPPITPLTAFPEPTAQFSMILPHPTVETLQKELLPRVVATRDEKGQLIFDPEKLADWEKNLPTFEEQMGKEAGFFDMIDKPQWDLMNKIHPGAGTRKAFQWRAQVVLLRNENASLRKRIEELEAQQPKKAGMFGAKVA